jgi:hypothetical protein
MKPNKIPVLNKATITRFKTKFKSGNEDDCWEYEGCTSYGYGKFRIDTRMIQAHRISWTIKNGEIPEGLLVLHKCDNRICINPNHLFLGTNKDNMRDMHSKNRCINKKLSDEDILLIRASKDRRYKIMSKFGISESYLSQIKSGIRRKNG